MNPMFVSPRYLLPLSISVVAATLLLLPARSEGGGFATARFGGPHGHPTTDNPTAIYYNPAGMALGSGTRIFAEGLAVYRAVDYDRPVGAINNVSDDSLGTPTDAVSANSGKAQARNFLFSPFLGAVSDFGVKNLGVGIGVFAPFGGQAKWDQNDAYRDNDMYPGAVDGVARWATMEGSIREVYISAGGAYRLEGPRLSIGATISLVNQSLNTIRARNAVGTDDILSGSGNRVEGRSHVDVSSRTLAAGLGIIWEPADNMWVGFSYQSQPGFGETKQQGVLNTKLGGGDAQSTDIDFAQELPDIFRIGFRYRPQDKLELRFAADYTRWSVFTKQCLTDATNPDANCTLGENGGTVPETEGVIQNIVRNWDDTFGIRVGGSYFMSDKLELATSFSFDSSAVPDETLDPSLLDQDKFVAVLGGRFQIMDNMLLNLSYTHVYYVPRESDPRERDENGRQIGFDAPSANPDFAGKYKQMIGLINLGAEYRF